MDLAAINIQRGRDHGLAPYNIWREQCGLKRFQTWDELADAMDRDTALLMKSVYEHVDDVDLFTGGMAEKPVVGGIIGPTFACILGQQFLNLRRGDRFWYENGNHPGGFTPEQLQEIRTVSLSRVICDCLDDVEDIQPFAFLQPDLSANKRTGCRGRGGKEGEYSREVILVSSFRNTKSRLEEVERGSRPETTAVEQPGCSSTVERLATTR